MFRLQSFEVKGGLTVMIIPVLKDFHVTDNKLLLTPDPVAVSVSVHTELPQLLLPGMGDLFFFK